MIVYIYVLNYRHNQGNNKVVKRVYLKHLVK